MADTPFINMDEFRYLVLTERLEALAQKLDRLAPEYKYDEYEVANLRAGLLTLRALGLDTGDWLGQILNNLPPTERKPNKTVEEQIVVAHNHMRWSQING